MHRRIFHSARWDPCSFIITLQKFSSVTVEIKQLLPLNNLLISIPWIRLLNTFNLRDIYTMSDWSLFTSNEIHYKIFHKIVTHETNIVVRFV